jgi:Xaa-Pro aminopeptidase
MDQLRHHTGHAFGLEGHEHPFLDLDDHTPILPGMIFSLEPGL